MSRTKIFIRHPRTLFATEDAFQVCKHKLGETGLIISADNENVLMNEILNCCFHSNNDSGQVQRLQGERRLPETERGWWVMIWQDQHVL